METYTLNLHGLTRKLPITPISENMSIASFVILGDTELVAHAAPLLADRLPEIDVLITAEAKGIPLVYELSKQLEMKPYFVARKSTKAYMKDPLIQEVFSITTQRKQILCLDGGDARQICGKRTAIIDDVISTGESLKALEDLVAQAGGIVEAKAAILAEGDAAMRKDIIFLAELPIFPRG